MLLVEGKRDDAVAVARRPLRHPVSHRRDRHLPAVGRDHAVTLEERVQLFLHRPLVVPLVEQPQEGVIAQHEIEGSLRPGSP